MPPLLSPSPNIVDQSFPRSLNDLELINRALGRLSAGFMAEEFILVLTPPIRAFIAAGEFDWSQMKEFPQLLAIYNTLAQIALDPRAQNIDVSRVERYRPHPLPEGTESEVLAEYWSDEVGRLYALHQQFVSQRDAYFIGVACTQAFAGNELGKYHNPEEFPHFPLVGPADVSALLDAEEWDVADDILRHSVSFETAKTRIKLLGGVVTKPKGSSHYQVKFSGGRTWPLDYNYKDVPERFLKELEPITRLPISVIKHVLLTGKFPFKKFRFKA